LDAPEPVLSLSKDLAFETGETTTLNGLSAPAGHRARDEFDRRRRAEVRRGSPTL